MERGQKNRNLSKAIQTCIADLVDTMPFNDSEIPDILIQEGCITEDECKEIREKPNRKDQVRTLILLIKGRNFDLMKKYLDIVDKHCPTAAQKVWDQYKIFMNENIGPWKCPMCELKDCVDVKYVMDSLYGTKAITTGLYANICNSTNLVGEQDDMWDSVLKACSGVNLKYLTDALKAKGHYNFIADCLSSYHMRTPNDASCLCSNVGAPPVPPKSDSDETESSTTYSPKSTPLTSFEDENTPPKVLYKKKKQTTSRDRVQIISAVTNGANTGVDDGPTNDEVTEPNHCFSFLYACLSCCRKKPVERNSYNEII